MAIKRLLIGAGASEDDLSDLPVGVRELIDSAEEILVMAPALPSRLDWLTSDTDKTRAKADQRLQNVVAQLENVDSEVKGTVGADDPILAFDEAMAEFPADHILLALRSDVRSGWQEAGLIDEVIDRFGVPVTSFKIV